MLNQCLVNDQALPYARSILALGKKQPVLCRLPHLRWSGYIYMTFTPLTPALFRNSCSSSYKEEIQGESGPASH